MYTLPSKCGGRCGGGGAMRQAVRDDNAHVNDAAAAPVGRRREQVHHGVQCSS